MGCRDGEAYLSWAEILGVLEDAPMLSLRWYQRNREDWGAKTRVDARVSEGRCVEDAQFSHVKTLSIRILDESETF